MNYGKRQARAEALVKFYKEHPNQTGVICYNINGRYTAGQLVAHIVDQTELGWSLVGTGEPRNLAARNNCFRSHSKDGDDTIGGVSVVG